MPFEYAAPEDVLDRWIDHELTEEQATSLLHVLMKPTAELLGLDDWNIVVHYDDLGGPDDSGIGTAGNFTASWDYRRATITFDIHNFNIMHEFIEAFAHEHIHLFFAPLEKLASLKDEMYHVDPRSESYISRNNTYFREIQVADLRQLLGARMEKLTGFSIKRWLLSLAAAHLEEKYGDSFDPETAGDRAGTENPEHRRVGAEGSGAALHTTRANTRRNHNSSSSSRAAAARNRACAWRRNRN